MARPIDKIIVTDEQLSELRPRVKSPRTSKRDPLRAEILLLRSSGMGGKAVAKRLLVSENCVSKWTTRFRQGGIDSLADKSGRGRTASIPLEKVEEVITKATCPPKGKTRWSTRTMGKAVGVSNASVQRIRSRNRIKPHRIKTFKVSNDPRFEEKFRDVIGLSLEPPKKAIVLCCDDKIQCQALERTQPGLPLGVGHIETKTHDDTRHGTIPLFAAPDSIEGRVLERTEQRHTQVEWLSKSPHFHLHFTPTSSSWLNLVERFFADITQECIRDGSFESVSRLEKAIHAYIEERNANPKPYRWVAEGKSILEKINRARTKLNKPVYETEH